MVLHDELESPLGRIKIKSGGGKGAGGHNGLKSLLAERDLGLGGGFWRIGVGIGRCESREREDVARYVMRRMSEGERRAVEAAAGEVIGALLEIGEGGEEG